MVKIIKWRNGWITEKQKIYIKAIEKCPGVYCDIYRGVSTRDASKFITTHESEYNDFLNEESALDAALGIGQE